MVGCKIQPQKCRFSEAKIEDRLIELLRPSWEKMTNWSSTRQWTLLEKEKPQLMTWNLLSNNKVHQRVAVKPTLMLSIKTPNVENVRLTMEKMSIPRHEMQECNQWNHWEQVCRSKQTQDRENKPPHRPPPESRKPQGKSNQDRIHLVEESNSDFDELWVHPDWQLCC